jgi:NAD(P)-dependent dehydrogenase (short-subunit alcohol dehydrogenase family)
MKVLRDRVAVVTGGASGIGFALAKAFAAEGMKLVLADIEQPRLEEARQALSVDGLEVIAVRTDVSQQHEVEHLLSATLQAFGAVHVLCNNAGVSLGSRGPVWQASVADWEWMLAVNLWGVIHGVRTFMPVLLEQPQAHVINTASIAGLIPAVLGVYSVTKHAVVALSEALQYELTAAHARVGVSVLCPGWVQTRIGEAGRNRPDRFQNATRAQVNPAAAAAREALVQSGTPPETVAACVVDAVRSGRFYVLPHPEWIDTVISRSEAIARGDPPPVVDLANIQHSREPA